MIFFSRQKKFGQQHNTTCFSIKAGKMAPVAPYLVYLQDGAAQRQLMLPQQTVGNEKQAMFAGVGVESKNAAKEVNQCDDDLQNFDNDDLFDEMEEMDPVVNDDDDDGDVTRATNGESEFQDVEDETEDIQREEAQPRQIRGMATSSDDPDFITHYHGHSRLHYLSTWGKWAPVRLLESVHIVVN